MVLVGVAIVDDGTNVTPVVLEDPGSPGELVVGKKLVGGNGVNCAEARKTGFPGQVSPATSEHRVTRRRMTARRLRGSPFIRGPR